MLVAHCVVDWISTLNNNPSFHGLLLQIAQIVWIIKEYHSDEVSVYERVKEYLNSLGENLQMLSEWLFHV